MKCNIGEAISSESLSPGDVILLMTWCEIPVIIITFNTFKY